MDEKKLIELMRSVIREEISDRLDRIEKKLDTHHLENIETDNKLLQHVQDIMKDLRYYDSKLIEHDKEIFKMKN